MDKILITGFDPFGGESVNPAWEVVKRLNGVTIEGCYIEGRELPTVFGKSKDILMQAIEESKPDAVICVGQAGGRADITLERIAVNLCDARQPDNEGNQPVDQPVVSDGPAAYWTTLPVKKMVQGLRDRGIPASISYTAGAFVCNQTFYELMHYISLSEKKMPGGFIHIPYLPEQAAMHPGSPSMALDHIVKGLEQAISILVSE